MNPDRWESTKRLFHEALERPPSERDSFVRAAAAADTVLRDEVLALLSAQSRADAAFGDVGRSQTAHAFLPGTRLGAYEIHHLLGVGGMGEVYHARDTRLRREVAIKILPAAVADDPERRLRFEREAHLLAALNHPNIGAIYGLEEADVPAGGGRLAVLALVLELVEGPTLADRIAAGPIPIDEAVAIARQIADALEAAHERGIVHRDLKPANVKVTPDGVVKVLDFGLAKAETPAVDATQSPTIGTVATRDGVIAGTAPYMSPEQARGKPVDKRADIWAFGCVLYEMLTGTRAFPGDTATDALAAVVTREPDWIALPANTPAPIRRLLRRCLEKDRKRRLADAADARLEIDDAVASSAVDTAAPGDAQARRVAPVPIALALAGGALVAALVTWAVTRPAPQASVLPSRFALVPSPAQSLVISTFDRDLALSPDGRHVVYRAGGTVNGGPLLVRAIGALDAQPLASVTTARQPFFSPDSRWIGFVHLSELRKVSLTGGPAITICRLTAPGPRGASWGDDNTIVFASNDTNTGLLRVSADGGEPTVLTNPAPHEGDHLFPSTLPGGRGVLFTISPGQAENAQVAVLDLKTGEHKTLIRGGSAAEYVETGHLIYAAAGALRAVRFDLARLEVMSDPVPVVEHVMVGSTGAANYAVSRSGTLVYAPGGAHARRLVWVDRQGHETPIKAPPRAYAIPRISPDGTRVALDIRDQADDIWIWDLARETLSRLTSDPARDYDPVWTSDGRRLLFSSTRESASNVYWQAADGTGTAARLTTSATGLGPTSITPDGTRVVGWETRPDTQWDVVLIHLATPVSRSGPGQSPGVSPSRVEPLLQTSFGERNAEISPDGRFVAYESNESGQAEIYVRPFPQVDLGGRWQVSTGGGTQAVWARNGRELFYLDRSNILTAVSVQITGPTFSAGNPARVFKTRYATPVGFRTYDVSPDGQRFLMIEDDQNATPAGMVLVLNWTEELKRLVPAK